MTNEEFIKENTDLKEKVFLLENELTAKHKNVKPDTRMLARRKRERRKTIDPDSMCK